MNSICILAFVCIAAGVSSYEVISDGEREYLLVPLDNEVSRTKRQTTTYGIDPFSKRAGVSHSGVISNSNNHLWTGSANASKGTGKSPLSVGGNVDYLHKPSGSTFGAQAQHTQRYGTDVGLNGRYNFINKPNTNAFVQGQYNRHFGGPFGTGRPNYGVGVGLQHRF